MPSGAFSLQKTDVVLPGVRVRKRGTGYFSDARRGRRAQGGLQAESSGEVLLPGCCTKGRLSIHTFSQTQQLMIEQRLRQPLLPFTGWLDGPGIDHVANSQAGPGLVSGCVHEVSTERVPQHIPQDGEKVSILLDGKAFKAASPDMPVTW